MKWPERWLVDRLRQNGKNRIRSYLLRNGSYGATVGGNGNGAMEFFT